MISHSYAHLILDKVTKIYDREKTVSSTNVSGKSGYLPAENCYPIRVSTQNGLRTFISDLKPWN
jgi:hypothetical protein